jgi:hypothetical protein
MRYKYAPIILLGAGLFFLIGWLSSPAVMPNDPAQSQRTNPGIQDQLLKLSIAVDSLRTDQLALDQRFVDLERERKFNGGQVADLEPIVSRLEVLESKLDGTPDNSEYVDVASIRMSGTSESMRRGASTEHVDRLEIRASYENDNDTSSDRRIDLEDAEGIFENDTLGGLEFNSMDCRERYCKLQYSDYSKDRAEAGITENELLSRLSLRYGDDITIHNGDRNGNSKSLYIEFLDN